MTTFSDPYTRDPDARCKKSPDGKYFFVITTKGVLKDDTLVSTLWMYSASAIRRYLHYETETPPSPLRLLEITGTPVAQQNNSYGSLIIQAQWSSDSKSILTLVERADGYHHLFRTYLAGRSSVDLTPAAHMDIKGFSEAGGTIAYLVSGHMPIAKVIGHPIDSASSDLTGVSLFHILFPRIFPDASSFWPALSIWVHYRGVSSRVNAGGKWYFPSSAAGLHLAVSPDGHALVAARPVPTIPAGWLQYKIVNSTAGFAQAKTGADRSGKSFDWPWQYIYVNLKTMKVVPLVSAPSGFLEGYNDHPLATWSADNSAVLFTNTFLPIREDAGTLKGQDMRACAAAVYVVASRSVTCVAYPRFPPKNEWLQAAAFGGSANRVVLYWAGGTGVESDSYQRTEKGWVQLTQKGNSDKAQPELRMYIRQDLNEAPTLWAGDAPLDGGREVWNPNPQLASFDFGRASVYIWRDKTGYEWHGGLVLPPVFDPRHRYPLVIQTHGFYNEHEFLVDGSFTTGFSARALAASGIVVLQMEDRSDRHVRPPEEEALLSVDGFKSAVESLNKAGLIDSSRVGIIGFSRTAWYVEEALILCPHLFRAATLIDGVDQSYLTYMLFAPGDPEATVEAQAANGGQPFGPGLENWVKSAPGFNLDKVSTPVRIEAIGPISTLCEWEIYSSLYEQHKPVDLVYLPSGQHILQSPRNRYASQEGNVEWFRFWLEDYMPTNVYMRREFLRWGSHASRSGVHPN